MSNPTFEAWDRKRRKQFEAQRGYERLAFSNIFTNREAWSDTRMSVEPSFRGQEPRDHKEDICGESNPG